MSDFELLEPLTCQERDALANYKNFSDSLNGGLRNTQLDEELTSHRDALDSALRKGRSTQPLTLYRATCARYVKTEAGDTFSDPGFVSTSLQPEGLLSFYCAEAPAKLIIDYAPGLPLACFPCDAGGGGENERLLPRGITFRVKSTRHVQNRNRILDEQCTNSDRGELYLKTGAKLIILELEIED